MGWIARGSIYVLADPIVVCSNVAVDPISLRADPISFALDPISVPFFHADPIFTMF